MKKLTKGFTLIELLVVIAIIGILATTIAPKMREQLAKSKDSKVVALLASVRTMSEVLILEKTTSTTGTSITFGEVLAKIESEAEEMVGVNGSIKVGGIREANNDYKVRYGGMVYVYIGGEGVVFTDKLIPQKVIDDANVHLGTDVEEDKSVEGRLWREY